MSQNVSVNTATSQEAIVMTATEKIYVNKQGSYEIFETFSTTFEGQFRSMIMLDRRLRESVTRGRVLQAVFRSRLMAAVHQAFVTLELFTVVAALVLAVQGVTTEALSLVLSVHLSWVLLLTFRRRFARSSRGLTLVGVLSTPALYCVALLYIVAWQFSPRLRSA